MSELLKDISVRITATDKYNKSCVGSGSIINYKGQNYVITAEHCINGTKNNKQENRLDIQSRTFKIEYKKMADEVFKEISHIGIFIENEENDFAVIQIKQVNHDLPKIEFLDKLFIENENYVFRGFPVKVLEDYSRKYDITVEDKDFSLNKFLIKAKDKFEDSSGEKVSYLASGISGSGIFLVDDGTVLVQRKTDFSILKNKLSRYRAINLKNCFCFY